MSNKKRLARPSRSVRVFSFVGNHIEDDIVIGDYGNATVRAKGHFNLSGIIYCRVGRVQLLLNGTGQVSFRGKCKNLFLKLIEGDCILDLRELSCDTVTCDRAGGQVTIQLGDVRRVDIDQLDDDATLKLYSSPLVTTRSINGNARIICPRHQVPPLVVQT